MEILSYKAADFAEKAADFLEHQIKSLLMDTSIVNIAISGGKSPIPIYETLRVKDIEWAKINFFLVDERCVDIGSSDSNFETLYQGFFKHINASLYPILKANMSFEEMAVEYEQKIKEVVPQKNKLPSFDLILLGMGLDGHTASLFPGTEALRNEIDIVTVNKVSIGPHNRITFTYPLLLNAKKAILLIKGSEKLEVLNNTLHKDLPIAKLVPVIDYVLN